MSLCRSSLSCLEGRALRAPGRANNNRRASSVRPLRASASLAPLAAPSLKVQGALSASASLVVSQLADYGDVEAPSWALPLLVVVGTLAATASGLLLSSGANAQEEMTERDENEWFKGKYARGPAKDPLGGKGGKRRRR
ncbi:hypothetical protein NFJ02_17g26310 [Pycnococcus provasolii]|uniref:Uncharacterized protein n=1 Tax=Pycnococcus provasolii TaxID=41880 RepID=A0A7S2YV22_9CHLO|mmetsp:Transcript_1302/g.3164  ORF Transcript_1302/g.3164 Transcript_1302/m.3164 type:complete len:139 (+) Transcript_1302:46-462(+)